MFEVVTNKPEACRCHSWYYSIPERCISDPKSVIIDIKALTIESPALVSQLGPAFEKYNEEQFATVKLPGSSQYVRLVFSDWGKDIADVLISRS